MYEGVNRWVKMNFVHVLYLHLTLTVSVFCFPDDQRPLHFIYTVSTQELVIRKPGINISTDFSIKLS